MGRVVSVPETLHGPWRVNLTKYVEIDIPGFPLVRHRLSVTGSDNADGLYVLTYDNLFSLGVRGSEWSLSVLRSADSLNWTEEEMVSTTTFVDPGGFVLKLYSLTAWQITFTCTCEDPDIGFPMNPNPYDFTLPSH